MKNKKMSKKQIIRLLMSSTMLIIAVLLLGIATLSNDMEDTIFLSKKDLIESRANNWSQLVYKVNIENLDSEGNIIDQEYVPEAEEEFENFSEIQTLKETPPSASNNTYTSSGKLIITKITKKK